MLSLIVLCGILAILLAFFGFRGIAAMMLSFVRVVFILAVLFVIIGLVASL